MIYRSYVKKMLLVTCISICCLHASQHQRTFTTMMSNSAQTNRPIRTISQVSRLPADYHMISLDIWKDQLVRAIESKNAGALKDVLEMRGLPKDAINQVRYTFNRTPLMEAVATEDKNIVYELIKAGSNLEAQDQYNKTVLFYAVQRKHLDIVRMLLCAGAESNRENTAHETPLILAVKQQQLPMITLLVTMGADDKWKTTAHTTIEDHLPVNTVIRRTLEDAIAQGRKARTAFEQAHDATNRELYAQLKQYLPDVLADISCQYHEDLRQFICEQMQTEEEKKAKSNDEMDAFEVTQAYSQES